MFQFLSLLCLQCPYLQSCLVTCDSTPVSIAHDYPANRGAANGNTLQYSCLENSTDRGAWQATYNLWGCKESDTIEQAGILLTHRLSERCSSIPSEKQQLPTFTLLKQVILACRKALIKLHYIIFSSYIFSISILSAKSSPQLCIPRI